MHAQPERLLTTFAHAARRLHVAPSEQERLQLALELTVEQVPGCTHAGLVRRRQRKIAVIATSDDVAEQAGSHPGGPKLEVFDSDTSTISADLDAESRWPGWTEHVRDTLGVSAVVCVPLRAARRPFGVLALYFEAPICDVPGVLACAEAFATHLALAIDTATTIKNQAVALETRTEIAQAQGILMARSGLTADAAFAYLQRLSQTSNRKLHAIAQEVLKNRGPISAQPPVPPVDGASAHGLVASPSDSEV